MILDNDIQSKQGYHTLKSNRSSTRDLGMTAQNIMDVDHSDFKTHQSQKNLYKSNPSEKENVKPAANCD